MMPNQVFLTQLVKYKCKLYDASLSDMYFAMPARIIRLCSGQHIPGLTSRCDGAILLQLSGIEEGPMNCHYKGFGARYTLTEHPFTYTSTSLPPAFEILGM